MPDKPQMTPSEMLFHTTVRIDELVDGKPKPHGTGFLMDFSREEGASFPALVTNRHVMKDVKTVRCLLTTHDEAGGRRYLNADFETSAVDVVYHPDPAIDLCALPIAWIDGALGFLKQGLHHALVSIANVPDGETMREFSAIEDVVTVGYPADVRDDENNLPMARKGITATPLQFDYNGNREFLVDVPCFGGCSGSPVYLFNEGFHADSNGMTVRPGIARFYLVGVIQGNIELNAVACIRGSVNGDLQVKQPMDIANAVKADELFAIERIVLEKAGAMPDEPVQGLPELPEGASGE